MGTVRRVTAADDERLGDYVGLTDVALRRRREPAEGLFIAEGEKVIRRALDAGYAMRSMLLEEKWLPAMADVVEQVDAPVYLAEPAVARAGHGLLRAPRCAGRDGAHGRCPTPLELRGRRAPAGGARGRQRPHQHRRGLP